MTTYLQTSISFNFYYLQYPTIVDHGGQMLLGQQYSDHGLSY